MIKKILLTGVFLLLATSASGEYYQYTDESGNTRFTDDLYQVPEAQRSGVKTFESVVSQPEETAAETSSGSETDTAENPETEQTDATSETARQPETSKAASSETGNDTGESAFQTSAAELNKIQSELNEAGAALEKEKADLAAQVPKENATTNERIAYSFQVEALNAKIVQHGKDLKAFEEKVETFNNRKKKIMESQDNAQP